MLIVYKQIETYLSNGVFCDFSDNDDDDDDSLIRFFFLFGFASFFRPSLPSLSRFLRFSALVGLPILQTIFQRM